MSRSGIQDPGFRIQDLVGRSGFSPIQQRIIGLYVITPEAPDTAKLQRQVRLALQGGARVLQYRNKLGNAALRMEQATALRQLTREFTVPLIINDDVALAARVDADGVHLGCDDGSIAAARHALGFDKIIGVSCYNDFNLAQNAVDLGADYIAFGAFFASAIKPSAPVAMPDLLRRARREINLPVVAIGGITAANGASLLEAGASALAVISAVFSMPDVEGATRDFSNLFKADLL